MTKDEWHGPIAWRADGLVEFAKGPPLDAWDRQIIGAIETAERMAFLHNSPCNVIAGPGRDMRVYPRLAILTQPDEVVLETIHPKHIPFRRSSKSDQPDRRLKP